MMCSAAASQATTWMAIQTKLELVKELRKADLISHDQYKFNLKKLAEEVGIETKLSLEREYESIYTEMALKAAE